MAKFARCDNCGGTSHPLAPFTTRLFTANEAFYVSTNVCAACLREAMNGLDKNRTSVRLSPKRGKT